MSIQKERITLKWRRETFFNKPPRHFQKIQRSVWEVPSFSQAWRPGMPMLRPAFWPWHHRPDSDPCSLQQSCLLLAGVPILDLPKPKSREKKGRVSLPVRIWDHILNTEIFKIICNLGRPGKSHGWRSLAGCSPGGHWARHDWETSLSLFTFMHWRRKWQPTPVFLPGESQGRGSLVGCPLWGRTESDTTEVT